MLFLDGFGRQYLPRQPKTLESHHDFFLNIAVSWWNPEHFFPLTFAEKIIISDKIKQHKTYNGKLLNYSSQAENLKEKWAGQDEARKK